MFNEEINWSKKNENEKSDHSDYWKNLSFSKSFIKNCEGGMPKGMKIKIDDSHHLKKALLSISWISDTHADIGNYSNPVCMHQTSFNFEEEVKKTFNHYMLFALKHVLNARNLD